MARADGRLVRARLRGTARGTGRRRVVGARPRRLLGLLTARAAVGVPAADVAPSLARGSAPRLIRELHVGPPEREPADRHRLGARRTRRKVPISRPNASARPR